MAFFSLPVVLDVVAKASVILAITALVALSLRRASASARHFVWTLGLLSALAAPVLTLALPRWEVPIVRVAGAVATPQAAVAGTAAPAPRTAPAFRGAGDDRGAAPAGAAAAATTAEALPSWPALALLLWAAGATFIVARMLLGLAAVRWMSRRIEPVAEAEWLPMARALAADLGLRDIRFLRGAAGTMPMAWGVVRAFVVMPVDADTWPPHRVRVVLLHELAHVKRRDCLTHLVAQLACAAYWFNPLAWMAARRLRMERERACDDLVLAAGTRGSDYADQLLDIARVMHRGRLSGVLAGASLAMAQRSQLEGRLMAILDPSVPRRGLTRARAAGAAVLFSVVMVAIASVQPWAEARAIAPRAEEQAPMAKVPQDVVQREAVQARVEVQTAPAAPRQVERVSGGVASGVSGGVTGGVVSGIAGGIAGGIASITDAVVGGVAQGVAEGLAKASKDLAADGLAEAAKELAAQAGRQESARENGSVRDPRTVNALLEALKDTDKDVRETAMNALVQMRDPRMFEPLIAALRDASADVREHAAFGLGQLRDARAIDPLASGLKDQSVGVREQAAFALGQIRDRRAVEPLISALKDEKADVRQQAAFALGQLRDARAVDPLIIALKDADADVREQAAFALGQIGDARAIDGLTGALKDARPSVRQQAAFALGQIR